MISADTVRRWYTPVEVSTLQRWLLVSVVVNLVLLGVDLMRGSELVVLGVLGVVLMTALLNSLPKEQHPASRNKPSCWAVRCCCAVWSGCSPHPCTCLTSGCTLG